VRFRRFRRYLWHVAAGSGELSAVRTLGVGTQWLVVATSPDARMHVDRPTIVADPGTPGAYTFTVHLDHVNFGGQNSLHAKATLNWEPVVDQTAIDAENAKRLALFTAKEQEAFRTAFLDESRIELASDLQPRAAVDLRTEERTVVYRRLIQDMLTPSALVPQPDAQTQHVVAELLDSIFDVDKMLYFVSPEWWRPGCTTVTPRSVASTPTSTR